MAASFKKLSCKLRARVHSCCQRLLTARLGVRERILELLEGGVGGDGVGHVLCPLWQDVVPPEAVNE